MCEFTDKLEAAKEAVPALSPEEASALKATRNVVFVDPREQENIASTTGLIPGAFQVSMGDIEGGALPSVLADPTVEVVTACQAGPMGAIAAHALMKRGYSNVRYVAGGTQAWLDAGYATSR